MVSKEELVELGRLVIRSDLDVLYIKNVRIEENANEHGTMTVRFLSAAQLSSDDVLRCQGSLIRLMTTEGECVFCGQCVNINLIRENEYAEVEVTAKTLSIRTDQTPRNQTFQGTDKTLESVLAEGIGSSAMAHIDQDIAVPEMLSQEQETDWIFGRRIANQYGKQFFVNSKVDYCQIHIGDAPFQKKELGNIINYSVSRNVDKVRAIQNSTDSGASVFEYEETKLTISDLTVGVGYAVEYQGRTRIVTGSLITCYQGMVKNQITLANEEGLLPSAQQSMGGTKRSSILTGTVLEVEGNNVKVDFHSPTDTPRWIPYAHAVSNYFYSMPDQGDTVYVYYETGDSEKVVCLGSKHVNPSPDFNRYQDKMLTADNRMIQFGDGTINLVGNRDEFDGYGWEQAKITFNDEYGIEIRSTGDISLRTTDGGNIAIQAIQPDFAGMESQKALFDQMYTDGANKYAEDSGKIGEAFDAVAYLQAKQWDSILTNIKDTAMSTVSVYYTMQEFVGRVGGFFNKGSEDGEEISEEIIEPPIEEGAIDIYALSCVILQVGNTCVTFANGIIQIKSDTYMELGTDRSITYEHLEETNYTWRDLILDVAQCALDIVGALPIPGLSTAANLINAGISLARGDYLGAAMSAGSALMSLIPGANTAAAAGKVAAKVATKAPKVVKALTTVVKVVKAIKTGAETLDMALNTTMALYDVSTAIYKGEFDLNDPDCRQDLFTLIQSSSTYASSRIEQNTIVDKDTGRERFMTSQERKDARAQRRQARRDAVNNVRDTVRARLDEFSANRCSNGEPIDMVTGSFLIQQCDFILNDITGICAIERTYESLLAEEDSPVGKGWTLSLFSSAVIYDDSVEIILPDNHTETFLRTEEGLRNRRNNTKRLTLEEQKNGYILKEEQTGYTRFYDMDGRQMYVLDRNGNRTTYQYNANTLQKIIFASGQYLDFIWQENKIVSIQDCIGRKVMYRYQDGYLAEVEMVNGGVEKYAYNTQGCVTEITDANGVTYVHNEYDAKKRVTRQLLSNGQEYILLYNDDDRINTYLVPANEKEIRYVYNKNRQLIRTEYPDGTAEEIGYDDWENRIWEKDRMGNETHRIYDEYSHLLEERRSDGLTSFREYNESGDCVRMWDNSGWEKWCTYDAAGNLVEETEKIDNGATRRFIFAYDDHGRITAFTDANGNKEHYEYQQGFWRYIAFVTAGGSRYEYGLDRAGRQVTAADSDGVSNYAYDNFDLLRMATNPMGHTTKYLYDYVSNLVGKVLPNHYVGAAGEEKKEVYRYDAFHHRVSRTDELGAVYATLRDGEGNIIKEVNPNAYNVEQQDGAGVEYLFDSDDRNYLILYPDGGVERRWYDAAGNLTKVCLPEQYDQSKDDGAGYVYEYDCRNRLTQITAPDGIIQKRYVYDQRGNIIKVIDAKGMKTGDTDAERVGALYRYNYLGWLLETRIPALMEEGEAKYQLIQYQYDRMGNRIQEKHFGDYQSEESASGIVHTISYQYDAEDRLVQISDCSGAVLEYRYDSNNRRTYEKRKINDGTDQILRYRYDSAGRMVELIRTADRTGCGKSTVSVRYEYDKNGNMTLALLPGGGKILREYDPVDRLVLERHLDANGGIDNTTRFAYDKAGNLTCITDNQGRQTQVEYDLMNREIRRTERDGSVTRQFYNKNGQLIKSIRPNEYHMAGDLGAGTQYTYDVMGRIVTTILADGTVQETNIYDDEGQLVQVLDGAGNGASFRYDFGGRRTEIRTTGQAVQQYEYDARGNITGVLDGNSNRTEYILDKWGRITEIRAADGSQEYYAYDYAGNLTSSTDGEGNTTTYEYNGINQLASMTDPEGSQEIYAYDEEGRLCRMTDRNGTETTYTYNIYGNPLRRRAKAAGAATEELSERYKYTPEGLLKSAISMSTASGGMHYNYAYDCMGRLTEKSASGRTLLSFTYDLSGNLTGQTDVAGKTTEYHYNRIDRLTEVWDNGKQVASYEYNPDGTVKELYCGNLHTEYAYDADRNMTGLRTQLGNEVLADNRYLYDGNGNRTEKRQKQGRTTYTYDAMNRLSAVEYPGRKEELIYDKAGNRTRRVCNGMEELYRYDSRNRLREYNKGGIATEFTYDKAGNLIRDGKAAYTYDAFNRTSKVETFDGNIQINRYDAEGLRHEMEENGRLVQFIFRGDEVVAEETQESRIRYIRSGELLASDAENARTYYHYASDEMGSITHVTAGVAKEGGEEEEPPAEGILNRYEYDAWGNSTACEETVENRFRFTGQQYDTVAQQYYLRARFYNPVLGRFTQEDTYRGDGLNLYAYCRNNPVYYVDPSGNICERRANTLMDTVLSNGELTRKERRQLVDKLNADAQNGTITVKGIETAQRLGLEIGDDNRYIAAACQNRATEINDARRYWEAENGTTGVMYAIDNETGKHVYLVSTNDEDLTVPKELSGVLNKNERYIGGEGHAEQTIMENKDDKYTILAGGTSRNVCINICKPLLINDGLKLGGPHFRGKSDKTRYRRFWRE
ncbi:MAG: RHS repeat protein [Acetatifactor sp.]|nr:RHS repeat protein [Acetatifactor sp.]